MSAARGLADARRSAPRDRAPRGAVAEAEAGRRRPLKATEEEADEDAQGEAPDLEPLEDYLDAPSILDVLVFVAAEIDRSRRLTKRLIAKAHDRGVRRAGRRRRGCAPRGTPDGAGVAPGGTDAIRAAPIEPDAARLLVSRAGHDITKLRGDVERLLLYTEGRKRISADDVMEVVADEQTVDDDWAVVNAIADGDAARALVETGRRFDRGDSPHQLLGQLRWWVSLATGGGRRVPREAGDRRPAPDGPGAEELRRRGAGAPRTSGRRADRTPAAGVRGAG